MGTTVRGWRLAAPNKLIWFEQEVVPRSEHVLVQVAGCGVCHTDLGFLVGDVPTRSKGPVVLGHEASGVVAAVGAGMERWLGRRVLVPAVWTCGKCRACRRGRPTACDHSIMPGNDVDGAFASHIEVPGAMLCPVDGDAVIEKDAPIGRAGLALWQIAVVADAVTTPLQAVKRCGLEAGELAVVIGVGGVGAFGVQLARARGAVVAALDVDPTRLNLAGTLGAHLALEARAEPKALRTALRDLASRHGVPTDGWRVFEMSGTRAGQELAWSLLTRGGSLSVVGYTPEPSTVRLSNLMALDATAYGNWGADPALYPEALAAVASGDVQLGALVRRAPLAEAPHVIEAVHRREIRERVVLTP